MKITIQIIESDLYNYNTGNAKVDFEKYTKDVRHLFAECNNEYDQYEVDAAGATKEQIEELYKIEKRYAKKILDYLSK